MLEIHLHSPACALHTQLMQVLIGVDIVGLVILLINVMYNYRLFNNKSTHA